MPNVEVAAQIRELQQIQRGTLYWRAGLTVAFLLVVIISLSILQSSVNGLAQPGPKQEEFTKLMGERMQTQILPAAQDLAQETIRGVDLPGSVQKLNQRAPDVAEAAMSEVRKLAENVPARGQKVLAEELEAALAQQEERLKKFNAQVTEEKFNTIMANLTEFAKTEVIEISQAMFTAHVEALNGTMKDLIKIEQLEAPTAQRDIPTWEMVFLITDIARDDFKMASAGSAPTALPGKKEK
jgi:hypothetical protein